MNKQFWGSSLSQFITLFGIALFLNSCIILPSNILVKAKKERRRYEMHLMASQPSVVFSKHGYFKASCGKILEASTCRGRYTQTDSLFVIKKVNAGCTCFYGKAFIYKNDILYEVDADSKILYRWFPY
jgi:hypothetical protein